MSETFPTPADLYTAGVNPRSKVVVVTGAARGIGLALCEQLAHAGHQLIAVLRSSARLSQVQAVLGHHGRAVVCDVGSTASVDQLFRNIAATEGRIDALINNAGLIQPIGHLADTDPEAWSMAIDVNLVGPYRCARAALPLLLANTPGPDGQRGVIINLSSGAARRPLEGWSAYCSAKAGLTMLGRSLHLEYGGRGIAVVGLAPGVVDTDMQASIRASGLNPVSQLPRDALAPAQGPARIIAALIRHCPPEYHGEEIDARDPAIAALARA